MPVADEETSVASSLQVSAVAPTNPREAVRHARRVVHKGQDAECDKQATIVGRTKLLQHGWNTTTVDVLWRSFPKSAVYDRVAEGNTLFGDTNFFRTQGRTSLYALKGARPFSRFDTIPTLTDRMTDRHRATAYTVHSVTAVRITLMPQICSLSGCISTVISNLVHPVCHRKANPISRRENQQWAPSGKKRLS